jgi:hypothetical protein
MSKRVRHLTRYITFAIRKLNKAGVWDGNRKAQPVAKALAKHLGQPMPLGKEEGWEILRDHFLANDGSTHYRAHLAGRKARRVVSNAAFYESREWLALRYTILRKYGRTCMLCRVTEGEMHVDHIKPRSLYPELELDPTNLQVLCRACNLGKSNKDSTDFRPTDATLQ